VHRGATSFNAVFMYLYLRDGLWSACCLRIPGCKNTFVAPLFFVIVLAQTLTPFAFADDEYEQNDSMKDAQVITAGFYGELELWLQSRGTTAANGVQHLVERVRVLL